MALGSFIKVDDINYCGKEAQEIFSKDLYQIDLLTFGVTFMDGVKGTTKLYSGEIGDVWQAYTCPFSPNGEVQLGEYTMTPVAIKVNLEECYDKFWNKFMVDQTSITLNGGVPQAFSDWFFGKLRIKMINEYQEIAWNGDDAYTGETKQYLKVTDGWLKQINEATGSTKITGASLTVDNVVEQIEAAISKAIEVAGSMDVDYGNYKVFMNHTDYKLLEVALGKLGYPNSVNAIFTNYSRGENGHVYLMGFEVVPTQQNRNSILVGPANNLVLGFDSYDSNVEYQLLDMRQRTGDNSFRIIALTNIAVGVIFPELFVLSQPAA